MPTSTVCICARDPSSRSRARASFEAQGWLLVEASPDELHVLLCSIKFDALVYIGPAHDLAGIGAVIAAAHAVVPRLVSVIDARRARDTLTRSVRQ